MTGGPGRAGPDPDGAPGPPALVPGELRGFRRFRLHRHGGLHPTVHLRAEAWSPGVERAVCAVGHDHRPPAGDCGCGLYGWYHPADARFAAGFGDVTAVVAAQGRVVLAEHGFRAEAARVQAVAVGRAGGRRAARAVAQAYPGAAVYRSRRRMLRDHPPDDLSALGVVVRPSPASRSRRAALTVWLVGLVALHAVLLLPRDVLANPPAAAWLPALAAFLGWQALLVRLVVGSTATERWSLPTPGPGEAPATGR